MRRAGWRHVRRLEAIMQAREAERGRRKPRRRGLHGQRTWREQERAVRRSAVVFLRWLGRHELDDQTAADGLGLSLRTLRDWRRRWAADQMELRARGRPADHADRELRRSILALFGLMGPHVGLPTLQSNFPDVARGELVELQRRYRYAYRYRNSFLLHVLRWTRAGSVWAMDFAHPPAPIDGLYPRQALLRDLGSKHQLAAMPVPDETGRTARVLLESHARWMGYPLVLKVDNGSAFISEEVRAWAREHQVLILYSPPRTPEYNGSIEAGVGSIKTRAHYEAARNDRPGQWTCDDVEAARLQANETGRPWGALGPTPLEAWRRRQPIAPDERAAFLALYQRHAQTEREARGWLPGIELQHREQAAVDRVAISRTLIDQGFLLVRRRRITLPIWKRFATKIS